MVCVMCMLLILLMWCPVHNPRICMAGDRLRLRSGVVKLSFLPIIYVLELIPCNKLKIVCSGTYSPL